MPGRHVAQGRGAGVLSAIGFNLGGYVHLPATVLGLAAILATSAVACTVVRWLGAACLYLGVNAFWRRQELYAMTEESANARNGRTILWQAFVSDVLNPKVALPSKRSDRTGAEAPRLPPVMARLEGPLLDIFPSLGVGAVGGLVKEDGIPKRKFAEIAQHLRRSSTG